MLKKSKALFVVLLMLSITLFLFGCKKNETNNTSSSVSVINSKEVKTESQKTMDSLTTENGNVVISSDPIIEVSNENKTNSVEKETILYTNEVSISDTKDEDVQLDVEVSSETKDFIELIDSKADGMDLFKVGELEFFDDGSIKAYYRYGMVVQAEVFVGDDTLTIEFNSIAISGDDISSFLAQYAEQYPFLAKNVTYEFGSNCISFHFPKELMGGKYYKLQTLKFLNDSVTNALDSLHASDETLVTVDEKGKQVITKSFEVFGSKVLLSASNTLAIIESDRAFTTDEIYSAANVLLANNSDLQYVQYMMDGNKIILMYPEISDEYLKSLIDTIDTLILAYTPMALPLFELEEDCIIEVEAKEEEPVIIVETKEIFEEVEEIRIPLTIVSVPEPVIAETKSGKKVKQSLSFSGDFCANLTPKASVGLNVAYEFAVNKNFAVGAKSGIMATKDVPFITYTKLMFNNVYAKAGVGFNYNFYENSFAILGEAGVGIEIPLEDVFSVFVEAGARTYCVNKDFDTYGYINVGGKVIF